MHFLFLVFCASSLPMPAAAQAQSLQDKSDLQKTKHDHNLEQVKNICTDFLNIKQMEIYEYWIPAEFGPKVMSKDIKEYFLQQLPQDATTIAAIASDLASYNEILKGCNFGEYVVDLKPSSIGPSINVSLSESAELTAFRERVKKKMQLHRILVELSDFIQTQIGTSSPQVDRFLVYVDKFNKSYQKYPWSDMLTNFYVTETYNKISKLAFYKLGFYDMKITSEDPALTYKEYADKNTPTQLQDHLNQLTKRMISFEEDKVANNESLLLQLEQFSQFLAQHSELQGSLSQLLSMTSIISIGVDGKLALAPSVDPLIGGGHYFLESYLIEILEIYGQKEYGKLTQDYQRKLQIYYALDATEKSLQNCSDNLLTFDQNLEQTQDFPTEVFSSYYLNSLVALYQLDKKSALSFIPRYNSILAQYDIGTVEEKEENIVYNPSDKAELIMKKGTLLLEYLQFLNNLELVEDRTKLDALFNGKGKDLFAQIKKLELQRAIGKNSAIPDILKTINFTAPLKFNVALISLNAEGELILQPFTGPDQYSAAKKDIIAFMQALEAAEESKDPVQFQTVQEMFSDFKEKYPEYATLFQNSLRRNHLFDIDITGNLREKTNARKTIIPSLNVTFENFAYIFASDEEVNKIREKYLEKHGDQLEDTSLLDQNNDGIEDAKETITKDNIAPLTTDEVVAIKIYTITSGSKILNVQNRIFPFPLEKLLQSSSSVIFTFLSQNLKGLEDQLNSLKSLSEPLKESIEFFKKAKKDLFAEEIELEQVTASKMFNDFRTGLKKLPKIENILFHGIPKGSFLDSASLEVGTVITHPDFISLSYDASVAQGFTKESKKLMIVKSKHFLPISRYSEFSQEEEFLLPAKSKLKITDIKKIDPQMLNLLLGRERGLQIPFFTTESLNVYFAEEI